MLIGDNNHGAVDIIRVDIRKSEGFTDADIAFRYQLRRESGDDFLDEGRAERACQFPRPPFELCQVRPDYPLPIELDEPARFARQRVEAEFHGDSHLA